MQTRQVIIESSHIPVYHFFYIVKHDCNNVHIFIDIIQ